MHLTTLCEAMTASPQLRSSCIRVVNQDQEDPGKGIKLLRLVSKQLRSVMLSEVRGYTLNIDGEGSGPISQMSLLEGANCSLDCLRVVIAASCSAATKLGGLNLLDICLEGLDVFGVSNCDHNHDYDQSQVRFNNSNTHTLQRFLPYCFQKNCWFVGFM